MTHKKNEKQKKSKKHNFDVRNHLSIILIVFVYLASLVIFKDEWISLINYLWVIPIAGKFDDSLLWVLIWIAFIVIVVWHYYFVLKNERKIFYPRTILLLFILSLQLFYCICECSWVFDGVFTWLPITLASIFEIINAVYICRRNYRQKKNKDSNTYKGLEFEKTNDSDSFKRNEYVEKVAGELIKTFSDNSSFAIGISGKWGSGKTTFTEQLKKQFENKVDIIMEFNPWYCKSSNDIIEDFFNEYRTNISTYIPSLSSTLRFYMQVLQNIDLHNSTTRITLKNIIPQKSSAQLYNEIKDTLKKASVNIVVIIDDLDRLDKNEILEVFRLIRNTANFPFTQFIVTYDKDYILKTLSDKSNIKYDEYLMKIFNLEIALPWHESVILCNELEYRLKSIFAELKWEYSAELLHEITHHRVEKHNSKLKVDDEEDDKDNKVDSITEYFHSEYKIPAIISSMRDVIRFTNSFRLNLSACVDKYKADIDISDFFYLELLRYRFTDVYYTLRNDPLRILYLNDNRYQSHRPFVSPIIIDIPNLELDNLNALCKNNNYDSSQVFYIIDHLFGRDKVVRNISIGNISNFFTYFANRIDTNNLSFSEVLRLFSSEEQSVLVIVNEWYKDNPKNEGQLTEKLYESLELALSIKNGEAVNLDYKIVYSRINFLLDNIQIEMVKKEVSEALVLYFQTIVSNTSMIDLINMEYYTNLIRFWLKHFDLIEIENEDVNLKMVRFILVKSKKELTDEICQSFSESLSINLSNKIYEKLRSTDIDSNNEEEKKWAEKVCDIQLNLFLNYSHRINDIDEVLLGFYDNAVSSARLYSRNVLKLDNIIQQSKAFMKELILKYPVSFINESISFDGQSIFLRTSLDKLLNKDEIRDFIQNIITNRKYNSNKNIKRVRNFLKLYTLNNMEFLSIKPSTKNDFEFDKLYDFSEDVRKTKGLNILDTKISKIIDNSKNGKESISLQVENIQKQFEELDIKLYLKPVYKIESKIKSLLTRIESMKL